MELLKQTAPKNILTVDDERIIQKMLHKLLTRQGYNVISAHNGKDALTMASIHDIDLIILDIMMPIMDGFETLRMLRQMEKTRHIPVVILTATANVKTFTRAIKMGADDFIAKPFDQLNLRRKLEYLLQDAERRKEELEIMLQEEKTREMDQSEFRQKRFDFINGFEKLFPKMVYMVSSQNAAELKNIITVFEKKCDTLNLETASRLALKMLICLDRKDHWDEVIKYLEEMHAHFRQISESETTTIGV